MVSVFSPGRGQCATVFRDITERKEMERRIEASLREKEVLLQEVHHRVKNNMQVISSLLSLSKRRMTCEEDVEVLRASQNRVRSMALIHDTLYRAEDLASITAADYLGGLVRQLVDSYGVDPAVVATEVNVESIFLGVTEAIPCGLIVNELVSNSLKHAFPGGRKGVLRVELSESSGTELILTVADDGVGFAPRSDSQDGESIGLQLVSALVEQLGGRMQTARSQGTTFRISFSRSTRSATSD